MQIWYHIITGRKTTGQEGKKMTYIIKKAKIGKWGYEITANSKRSGYKYHNIAPTIEAAISLLRNRFGADVDYKIK